MRRAQKILTVLAASSVSTAFGQGLLTGAEPAAWPKMGHEFRSGLTYDNRGFAKVDPSDKPKSLATMAVERAKLKFTGDLSPDVSFFVRLAFEPTAKQALDYAMLTLRLDEHWSVGSGKTWNYISGYEWPNSLAEYVGTSAFPFTMGATTVLSGYSKQTFELAHKGDINWRVQLFDDVKVVRDDKGARTGGGYFSSGTQPAGSLQIQLNRKQPKRNRSPQWPERNESRCCSLLATMLDTRGSYRLEGYTKKAPGLPTFKLPSTFKRKSTAGKKRSISATMPTA